MAGDREHMRRIGRLGGLASRIMDDPRVCTVRLERADWEDLVVTADELSRERDKTVTASDLIREAVVQWLQIMSNTPRS